MIEIKNKRSLNSKHFNNGTDNVMQAHAGHIHYFDKLDSKRFREISHELIWDEKKRGWGFSYHSFRPFFPEYSDGLVEFRDLFEDKDQTVKYKAIGTKVKGALIETDETNPAFDENKDNKGVLYKNAFGENRDYILYNTRSALVKVATVNNPNEQKEDAIFEWEVELPEKEIFRVEKKIDAEEMTAKNTKTNTEDSKLVGYKLDKTKAKNFNTNKQTLIGNSKLDGKEWFTYLRSYKAWDSEGNTMDIEAKLYWNEDKYILRKTIPSAFLQKAVGKVFTDTTTSFYAGAGDGWVRNSGISYTTVRSASTGNSVDYTNTGNTVWHGKSGSTFYVDRDMFPIDLSSLGTISVTAASFSMYNKEKGNSGDTFHARFVKTYQASNTALVTSDYNKWYSTAGATDIAVNSTNFTSGERTVFTLNSTGYGWIEDASGGWLKVGLMWAEDADGGSLPSAGNTFRPATSENSGTASDPYLEITYTIVTASFIPQVSIS